MWVIGHIQAWVFSYRVRRALLWGQGGPVRALRHELCVALWLPGNPCGSPRHRSTAAKGATGAYTLFATPGRLHEHASLCY